MKLLSASDGICPAHLRPSHGQPFGSIITARDAQCQRHAGGRCSEQGTRQVVRTMALPRSSTCSCSRRSTPSSGSFSLHAVAGIRVRVRVEGLR